MKKTPKKWPKWPNFKDIWSIKAKFWEKNYVKYIKVYISWKTILSAFHCFLFHKNIPNTFEVIALLLKTNNFWQFFGQFLPHLVQIFNQIWLFLTEITAIGFNSLKKTYNSPVYPHLAKKNIKNTKIDKILRKFGISRKIWTN